ncbi:hypothetical protein Bca4012_084121 [Brassica carinata]
MALLRRSIGLSFRLLTSSPVFKEFSTPSVLHFPYAKAPTVRLGVHVVSDVSFVSRGRMGSMYFRLRLTVTRASTSAA